MLPVDIKDGVDQEIIDIFLRQGDQKLVRKEEVEEIMSLRGRHVEMPKEQVAIVVYNGHVAVEEVNEVVHKEAGKLDGDQIRAQIAWALLVVNFILWLCVQVILGNRIQCSIFPVAGSLSNAV